MKLKVTQKKHIFELIQPGDFCFVKDGRIVIKCPFCLIKMVCDNKVLSRDSLTLEPSVVGPVKCEYKCGHHFFIRDGFIEQCL